MKRFFIKGRNWDASGKTPGDATEVPYLYKSIAP
jgi:hypothetical protein